MTYIFGDLHGCFYTLKKLIDKIRKKDESPHFVFVGDYVDRGLNSKQCVELLIQLQSEGAACLRGNHDDVVNWLLNGESVTDMNEMAPAGVKPSLLTVGTWWIANGLLTTIKSYIDVQAGSYDYDIILKLFVNAVPDDHKKFFSGLKMNWENETHFAGHAFFDPSEPLPRTLDFLPSSAKDDMLWSRFAVKYQQGVGCPLPVWDKIGVFGHSPMSYYGAVVPIKHGNLRLIDTGAYQDGYLCAFCIEQDDHILQATDSRDIP